MELRHLRYFIAVGSEGNFRRAAEKLHVSQPALSKQISDLEGELGVKLLERHSRGARLSACGRFLLGEAREILVRVDSAMAKTREAGRDCGDVLRIGQVGYLASSFLPQALAVFRKEFPGVDVKIDEMYPQQQFAAFDEGRIDVGITAVLDGELPKRFGRKFLLRTKLAILISKAHLLAAKARIGLPELRDETLLCFSDPRQPSGHDQRLKEIFGEFGLRTPRIKVVQDHESLLALLAGGHGLTIAPPFLETLTARGVEWRPIREDAEVLNIEIRAIWVKGVVSSLVERFVEIVSTNRV